MAQIRMRAGDRAQRRKCVANGTKSRLLCFDLLMELSLWAGGIDTFILGPRKRENAYPLGKVGAKNAVNIGEIISNGHHNSARSLNSTRYTPCRLILV